MNWAKRLFASVLSAGVVALATPYSLAASDYTIGVFYYPGWSPYTKGAQQPDPWADIHPYPERQPSLGWYHDGQRETMDQQLRWMSQFGIGLVTFDWYWENGKPAAEPAVNAYKASAERAKVPYALLWANHNSEPRNIGEWDALVDYWISRHLTSPEYFRLDTKPVVYIFSGDVLRDQAKVIGSPVSELLARARAKAVAAGLPGIYFVLCVPATDYWVQQFAPDGGFDATTAYNYHFGIEGNAEQRTPYSHSYAELDSYYRMQWNWILANGSLPYFPPMSSGWDKRPWGGSRDPLHDNSVSTPASFKAHVAAARALMDKYPEKTRRIGMICCWNEYGEGTYIEPTKQWGTSYLEQVQAVFGGGSK